MPEARYILALMGQREENVISGAPSPMVHGCTAFEYSDGSVHVHGPLAIFEIREIVTSENGHRFGAGGKCVNPGCEAKEYVGAKCKCPAKADDWQSKDDLPF